MTPGSAEIEQYRLRNEQAHVLARREAAGATSTTKATLIVVGVVVVVVVVIAAASYHPMSNATFSNLK